MKRLVKYLFTGFVCSALLVGCQGQDLENEPVVDDRVNNIQEEVNENEVIMDNTYKLFNKIVDYYNNENDSFDAYYNYANGNTFFLIVVSETYTFDEMFEIGFLAQDTVVTASETMEKNYNEDVITPARQLGFDGAINIVMKSTDNQTLFAYITEAGDDKITYSDICIPHGFNLTNEEPEQNYQGLGEVFIIGSYSAYYSETPYGEAVLNVHIDDDCLQVADLDAYYNLVANNAMGCDYIVMTFRDGSNCVIDHSTMEYLANQDINYYRN